MTIREHRGLRVLVMVLNILLLLLGIATATNGGVVFGPWDAKGLFAALAILAPLSTLLLIATTPNNRDANDPLTM